MQPQTPTQPPQTSPATPPPIPAGGSKKTNSLAIALVVSSVFLLAAAGIVAWLFVSRSGTKTAVRVDTSNDTKNVKDVSFSVPANLPSVYVKNDQSKIGAATVFYTDDTSNCTIATFVQPVTTAAAVKDTAIKTIESTEMPGVSTNTANAAGGLALKDANNSKTYNFDSVELAQAVNVPDISYKGQRFVLLYKQFGSHIATLAYGCKEDSWVAKKDELKQVVSGFTVKTQT